MRLCVSRALKDAGRRGAGLLGLCLDGSHPTLHSCQLRASLQEPDSSLVSLGQYGLTQGWGFSPTGPSLPLDLPVTACGGRNIFLPSPSHPDSPSPPALPLLLISPHCLRSGTPFLTCLGCKNPNQFCPSCRPYSSLGPSAVASRKMFEYTAGRALRLGSAMLSVSAPELVTIHERGAMSQGERVTRVWSPVQHTAPGQ